MLAEEIGDILLKKAEGHFIVIPTNGTVKSDGRCVMGAGLALDIQNYYPEFPVLLGDMIQESGNHVYLWAEYGIITFPVKNNWWEKADVDLIRKSCLELKEAFDMYQLGKRNAIYLPRVGCGNGKLDWKDVKPILEETLGSCNVIVMTREQDAR